MVTKTRNLNTSLSGDEVIAQAVKFFSTESRWKVTSQSSRSVIFFGIPPIPWGLIMLTLLGYLMCILPGIILSVYGKQRAHRRYHFIVNVGPISGGTEVCVQYPDEVEEIASRFIGSLPSLNA